MLSPAGPLVMSRFEKMPLPAKQMVEPSAARKPSHVKESSPAVASATPSMIGTSASSCGAGSRAPMIRRFPSAIQTGSLVFTTCVKDTEPQEKATEVRPLPRAWQSAAGRSRQRKPGPMALSGEGMAPVAQPTLQHATTVASWTTETLQACGKRPSACLFTMLKATFAAYHRKKPMAMGPAPAGMRSRRASRSSTSRGAICMADSCKGVCGLLASSRAPKASRAVESDLDCATASSSSAAGATRPAQGAPASAAPGCWG
mmetsp:Transcript_110494/g.312439  ORF Transcript_110494/g.312439 Transcript_110494/m.312439 type:complete len:259 (-) Transcript_110494:14-790(-)